MPKNITIDINWIDNDEEWFGHKKSLQNICKAHLDEMPDTTKDYYLVEDGDGMVYALMSVPKDLPEHEVTSPDGADFMALDYAMGEWGCTGAMYWHWLDNEWKYL